MTALFIVFAVIGVLALLTLLRLSVTADYGENGLAAKARIGPFTLALYPRTKITKKDAHSGEKTEEKEKKDKGGKYSQFRPTVKEILKILARQRHRLSIDNLVVHYTAAGENCAFTAISYGMANAAAGMILSLLENTLKIRKYDIATAFDFETTEPTVYVKATLSLAVWEIAYVMLGFAAPYIKSRKQNGKSGGKTNGKASNQ